MKKYLRLYIYNLIALWLADSLLEGIRFKEGYRTLAATALGLTLVNLLIKPLLSLLLLPFNIITLGAFRWLVNVVTLYMVTLLIPQFEISGFNFPGVSFHGFIILPVYISQFWTLVITSFLISLAVSFLMWVNK